MTNKYCSGGRIQIYKTFEAAKENCEESSECDCISDSYCNGVEYTTNKGRDVGTATGGCAWISKPTTTKGIHSNLYSILIFKSYKLLIRGHLKIHSFCFALF